MTPWIMQWDEAIKAGPILCGGKGWNLARLHEAGFVIPSGFVISADVYRELRQGMSRPSAEAFMHAQLPASLSTLLQQTLDEYALNNTAVAIRSSATLEDSQQFSFAGIHDSFLNLRTYEQIEQAILKCYASLWSERAISYRQKMNVDDEDVACAIVVSELIDAKASGIAFSCDPASGRRDLIAIAANFGLGESVVSGAVTPDEYRVHYHRQDITSRTLGNKQFKTICAEHGTQLVAQTAGEQTTVLSDEQIQQLSRLLLRVVHCLGEFETPQDVEWLFDGSQFYLTQARPVTALPQYTLPALRGKDENWTNGNFRDAVPMVLPQAARGFALFHINNILRYMIDGADYPLPAGIEFGRSFNGRFYCNADLMQWLWFDAAGMEPELTNINLGGHHQAIELSAADLGTFGTKLRRARTSLKILKHINQHKKRAPKIFSGIDHYVDKFMQQDVSNASDEQLLNTYYEADDRLSDYDAPFITLTSASGAIFVAVQMLQKKFGDEAFSLANALMAGQGDITSANQGYELMALAETASEDAAAKVWFDNPNFIATEWQQALPDESVFKQTFQHYLAQYGHRAVYEIDLTRPRWHEDPSYLLHTIKNSMGHTRLADIRAQQAQHSKKAWQRVKEKVSWPLRKLLKHFIRRAAEGAAVREMAKSQYVKLMLPMRALMLESGRRLKARDLLDDANDVIHLDFVELVAYFKQEWDGEQIKALVAQRKQALEQLNALDAPDSFINNVAQRAPARNTTVGQHSLHGVAVAPGYVTANAFVALSPELGTEMPAGSILVAPSTDPGWTPLFLNAAALVMETGGYMSHGSIVAREFGIPAVVNVADAMSQLPSGQSIAVNGDQGWVEKLS